MKLPSILDYIFNPKIIEEYLELNNDPDLSSTEAPFPFHSSEYPALRWHLLFATTACAYHHLTGNEKESLVPEVATRLNTQIFEVRVGDYVKAKNELTKVKGPLGPLSWLSSIVDKKVPMRIISITLINTKVNLMLELFTIAERSYSYLDWSAYKQIADEYAYYSLVSYWGREPNKDTDSDHLEGLSELVYAYLINLSESINGTSTER